MKYIPGDIEKRLIRISNRMGLEVEHSKQALTQLAPTPPLTYFDSAQLAHEMGHWVCAPKYRRHERYFGIAGFFGPKMRILDENFCDREDVRAHIVGASFLLQAKAPESVVHEYLTQGNLPDTIDRRCRLILQRLCRRGVISEELTSDIERIWTS